MADLRRRRVPRAGRVPLLGLVLLAACSPPTAGTAPSGAGGASTSMTPTTSAAGPTGSGDPTHTVAGLTPPFVERAVWVRASGGRSLRVYPTAAGRRTQGSGDAEEAWAEVLRLAPDADQPGMRAQFDCHWTYARLVAPDKPSWNLEPWRPVVSSQEMVDARCNPGGPESAES